MDQLKQERTEPIPGTVEHRAQERALQLNIAAKVGAVFLAGAFLGSTANSSLRQVAEIDAAHDRDMASMTASSKLGELTAKGIGLAYQASDLCTIAREIPLRVGSRSNQFHAALQNLHSAAEGYKVIYSAVGDSTLEQRTDHLAAVTNLTGAWTAFSHELGQVANWNDFGRFQVNGAYPTDKGYSLCVTAHQISHETMPDLNSALGNYRAAESTVIKLAQK